MKAATKAIRAIVGLFFDDGSLALVILALLIATGFARYSDWIGGTSAMTIIIAGIIAALLENVLRFAWRDSRDA